MRPHAHQSRRRPSSTVAAALGLLVLGLSQTLQAQLPALGIPEDGRSNGFRNGVSTAAHPLASRIGEDILRQGGNAVDAAIAIQFALNVVEPTSSGIGGGGFMMIYRAGDPNPILIDSREKAPAAATVDMFLDDQGNRLGSNFTALATSGISVGVPGTLLGLDLALAQFGSGRFTLAELIAPSVPLAEGFNINARLASLTSSERTNVYEETRMRFRQADGSPLEEGFFLQQPDLADTFRLIMDQGVAAFYTGPMAEAIVEAQTRFNPDVGSAGAGRMALSDLTAYLEAGADIRQPIVGDYRGYTIYGMPPPSSGGLTVMQMLDMVERFPLGDASQDFGFGNPRTLNVMVEAMRLAFADRAIWMGDDDPGFTTVPREGLLDPEYVASRSALIDPDGRLDNPEAGDPRPFDSAFASGEGAIAAVGLGGEEGTDTTHFTVVDGAGNAVSYTSTIEGTWGSGILVPGFGFLLNNELTDFNTTPTASEDPFNPGANDVAPFKRPRSSMAPTMVFDGDQFLAGYGSPGGSSIINTVFQITLNLIDHAMTLQQAIDAPRISVSGPQSALLREADYGYDAINGLVELGHGEGFVFELGSVQAVVVDPATGLRYGGADDRRAGTVEGTESLTTPSYTFEDGVLDIPFLETFVEGEQGDSLRVILLQEQADSFDFGLGSAGVVAEEP